eukprot:1817770-Rhodomonas_salina.2
MRFVSRGHRKARAWTHTRKKVERIAPCSPLPQPISFACHKCQHRLQKEQQHSLHERQPCHYNGRPTIGMIASAIFARSA